MTWQRVSSTAELERERVLGVDAGGQALALYCIDGAVYATGKACTHASGRLSDGSLDGDCIECPVHQALFNVKTGEAAAGPASARLKAFPCRLEGGDVWVDV
jgi:3-phenylpropionate/trans-cinnamate dioxygenase ferredoxin subunit